MRAIVEGPISLASIMSVPNTAINSEASSGHGHGPEGSTGKLVAALGAPLPDPLDSSGKPDAVSQDSIIPEHGAAGYRRSITGKPVDGSTSPSLVPVQPPSIQSVLDVPNTGINTEAPSLNIEQYAEGYRRSIAGKPADGSRAMLPACA